MPARTDPTSPRRRATTNRALYGDVATSMRPSPSPAAGQSRAARAAGSGTTSWPGAASWATTPTTTTRVHRGRSRRGGRVGGVGRKDQDGTGHKGTDRCHAGQGGDAAAGVVVEVLGRAGRGIVAVEVSRRGGGRPLDPGQGTAAGQLVEDPGA